MKRVALSAWADYLSIVGLSRYNSLPERFIRARTKDSVDPLPSSSLSEGVSASLRPVDAINIVLWGGTAWGAAFVSGPPVAGGQK